MTLEEMQEADRLFTADMVRIIDDLGKLKETLRSSGVKDDYTAGLLDAYLGVSCRYLSLFHRDRLRDRLGD